MHKLLNLLQRVFTICDTYNIKLKRDKCQFLPTKLKYLGYLIDGEGYAPDPNKTKLIVQMPSPTNTDELRRVLGLFGYYRAFIRNYADTTSVLSDLLKKNKKYEWTNEHERAISNLKIQLESVIKNIYFDPDKPTVVDTDASTTSVAACIQQYQGKLPHTVQYP